MYFALPNFFENFYLNNFFYNLSVSSPQYFRQPVTFSEMTGAFPYCSWGGHINNNQGNGAYHIDFVRCGECTDLALRFDFANLMLEETDFYDAMSNSIIDANIGRGYSIEISNLNLLAHLMEKYPKFDFQFVYSSLSDHTTPFCLKDINALGDNPMCSLVGLPTRLNRDFSFLDGINNKGKMEITVNPMCPSACLKHKECLMKEQYLHINYYRESVFDTCPKVQAYDLCSCELLTLDKLIPYVDKGITHFTFSPFVNSIPLELRLDFYIYYFIKDEFHHLTRKLWYQKEK